MTLKTKLLSVVMLSSLFILSSPSPAQSTETPSKAQCLNKMEGTFLAENGSRLNVEQPHCGLIIIHESHGNRTWVVRTTGQNSHLPKDLQKEIKDSKFKVTVAEDTLIGELTGKYQFLVLGEEMVKVPFSMQVKFSFVRGANNEILQINAQVIKGQINVNNISGTDSNAIAAIQKFANEIISRPVTRFFSSAKRI